MKWLKRWRTRTLLLAAAGTRFSTAKVDTDASGIPAHSFVSTYSSYSIPLVCERCGP